MAQLQGKKALFLITKSNWGGAQRYVFDLATNAASYGFEPVVAFGGTGEAGSVAGGLAQRLKERDVRTIFIPSLGRNVRLFADLTSFFAILRTLRTEFPDVLHVNSSKAAGLGALAGKIVGIPHIIYTAHGWPFWEKRGFISRAIIYFLSWLTALFSDSIIVVSDYDLSVAKKMPFAARKAVRIYNGIDLHFPLGSGDVVRRAFPNGVRITGSIGELTENKNQIALIEQAKNEPDMHVAIIGDGEDRAYLDEKIKEYGLQSRVKMFGFMPAREVLRGFDVFALPSTKEGLPYVLIEARAAGLPILANRVGGIGEILDAKDIEIFSLERMLESTFSLYERA